MRFALCVVVFSVCIVALQYTANANDVLQSDQQRSANLGEDVVATTTTTAAQQNVPLGSTREDSEKGRTDEGDEKTNPQTEEERARAAAVPAEQAAAKTITTTTAANIVTPQADNQLDSAAKPDQPGDAPKPEDGSAGKDKDAHKTPGAVERPREVAPAASEAEPAAPQTKTTTTVSVKTDELPDNSQTELQTPRTTTVVQTNSSPPSTPEREVAPGGHEPGKKNVGAPAKTTGDQSVSEARGARASVPAVEDSAVTPPTNIVKNNNGDNAGVQPNKHSGHKDTHQKQTPDATTTITEEQKASMDSSTTSSAAPKKETSPGMTSTLPKGFKIPQSVDKTDGISSVSVWFAFATLITLAVTAVAPVH